MNTEEKLKIIFPLIDEVMQENEGTMIAKIRVADRQYKLTVERIKDGE